MTDKEKLLTPDIVRYLFDYHEDGYLVWRNPRNKTKKIGQRVGGFRKDGRQQLILTVNGKPRLYLVYRLIWCHQKGEWPREVLDHINRNPTDDRIENLRDVSQSENNQNKRDPLSNNRLQVLGVCPWKGRYRATIGKDGKQLHLGVFLNIKDAEKAYLEAKALLHISN